ncbi:MAG: crossover junction endodeoxyribonuclease RuvC [marine bacterium B5-7]|nr:MAG: crossover junction endodeoxyribonuclease RuvC [marine bacterium B5-7]
MTTILGIDPGSRATGFGIVQLDGKTPRYVTSGCISVADKPLAERLSTIYQHLSELIGEYHVTEAAIESVFMHVNPSSALKLGQARGAAIVAVGQHQVPLAEYAPRAIKQAVVGYGAAKKDQMQHMVKHLLNLSGTLQADAADALAVALCHVNHRARQQLEKNL